MLYRITTPELVTFHYRIAGLVSRALAWTIDQLIIFGLLIGFSGIAISVGFFGFALIFLVKFALDFGYYTWFELRRGGQTPGKRLFGIRVVSARGARLTFPEIMIRTLFRVIDNPALIPFVGIVGAICAMCDPWHRRLGDMAADTIVIRDARSTLSVAMTKHRSRVNSYAADPQIRQRVLARVTRGQRDLMLDLMFRRDHLEPDIRERLFERAAAHFREAYALPEDAGHLSDEQTVLNLALLVAESRVGS
ncbi:MAG: hypothetical protein CMJ18_12500 [Phycisphaeraceae bacterium]|nr:hypothetical protein [Phycisphaeraceae bacterium]